MPSRSSSCAAWPNRHGSKTSLEPFQRRIAKAISESQRETVVLIPRGNGKTHLLAAIALHHLLTVEGAAVYCAAASREQARILFEAASAFAREALAL
jgi:phage terminase large subunit-like protein